MNRRKVAMACITADVYENGLATKIGIRAYIETRMSMRSFQEAIRLGQALRERDSKVAP